MKKLVCLIGLAGCTSIVTPPDDPVDPVKVYLLGEALHCGLILPRGPGEFVEYGYGDWSWYALGQNAWTNVFDTLLWPTPGALGRKKILASGALDLRRDYPQSELQVLRADRADVQRLVRELDERYEAERSTEVSNSELGMSLVHDPDGFWMGYTCADATAEWLRSLGCSVSWAPIRASLRISR